jgi:hypothetical protein
MCPFDADPWEDPADRFEPPVGSFDWHRPFPMGTDETGFEFDADRYIRGFPYEHDDGLPPPE